MNGADEAIFQILSERGVIGRRERPEFTRALDGLRDRGRVTAVLPGWYAPVERRHDLRTLVLALQRADPDSVVTGRAAARLTFWPELDVDVVEAAVVRERAVRPGYRFTVRRVDPRHLLEVDGLRLSGPALTALDLVPALGGEVIDRALRRRATDLATLRAVLRETAGRRGNADRLRALLDSRDGGWSGGERRLHVILREAGITGWVANFPVEVSEGEFFIDVAFEDRRLALELDGWNYHGRYYADFVATMRRHTAIEASGWRVLHFTADDLDHPQWLIAKVRQALGE